MLNTSAIQDEDIYFLKVYKVLTSQGCKILFQIFCWGCKKDPSETLENYLTTYKKMSKRDFDKHFHKTQQRKIRANPEGDKFDLTLLYACIKAACDDLHDWSVQDETKLEYLLTAIKDVRCSLIHEEDYIKSETCMKKLMDKIKSLFIKALECAGDLYDKTKEEINDLIATLNKNITEIVHTSLSVSSIEKYRKDLAELKEYHRNSVKQSVIELKCRYSTVSNVDPASFISGRETLKVKTIFSRLDLIIEDINKSYTEAVDYELLLEILKKDNSISILVIEGEAGAGKTTLLKLMLSEWASTPQNTCTVRGLDEYDLVLYCECKNKVIPTFSDLLTFLLPKSSYELTDKDLNKAVLDSNVLMLIDGLDELNSNSKKTFRGNFHSTDAKKQ